MVNNNLGYSIYSKDSLPQLGGKKKTRKSRSKKQRGSGLASSRPVDVERANNMLLQASRQGLSERVLESLENGADVNVKNNDERCATWAITSAIHPADKNPDRESTTSHSSTKSKPDEFLFQCQSNILIYWRISMIAKSVILAMTH